MHFYVHQMQIMLYATYVSFNVTMLRFLKF